MREAMLKLREAMGEDAMVLSSRSGNTEGEPWAEIAAAPAAEVEAYRQSLVSGGSGAMKTGPLRVGPVIIALVGPAGAGKTLTAVKLALSKHALGGRKVGFITLDTYRVGGVDEIQTYAELAGFPLEVVYNRREILSAVQRLRECQAVIVDTPGRAPEAMGRMGPWEDMLRGLRAEEIHLVVPAGLRVELARHVRDSFADLGVTHVLPSKLDQVPGDAGLAELVEAVGLPSRWVTDGQEVPGDLRPAGARIFTSMGRPFPRLDDPISVQAVS
jgi:flagellar biosynthesis protein FlhF